MDCLCKSGASSWSRFKQSKQDRESLSASSLDCLCQAGPNTWSDNFPFHKTILQILPLCKILFPGPVGALVSRLRDFFYYDYIGPPTKYLNIHYNLSEHPQTWVP